MEDDAHIQWLRINGRKGSVLRRATWTRDNGGRRASPAGSEAGDLPPTLLPVDEEPECQPQLPLIPPVPSLSGITNCHSAESIFTISSGGSSLAEVESPVEEGHKTGDNEVICISADSSLAGDWDPKSPADTDSVEIIGKPLWLVVVNELDYSRGFRAYRYRPR